jgi:hypothetical protein
MVAIQQIALKIRRQRQVRGQDQFLSYREATNKAIKVLAKRPGGVHAQLEARRAELLA